MLESHSPPSSRSIPQALLPLHFTTQKGANGDTRHHLSHHWGSELLKLPGRPSDKTSRKQPSDRPYCHPTQALLPAGRMQGEGQTIHPLVIVIVPTLLADGVSLAPIPPHDKDRNLTAVSGDGSTREVFHHNTYTISKAASTLPPRGKGSQILEQYHHHRTELSVGTKHSGSRESRFSESIEWPLHRGTCISLVPTGELAAWGILL